MCDALAAAVRLYVDTTGQRLKVADSPYPPDISDKELSKLLELPGTAGEHSASFLMKLLYSARMAAPWITGAILWLATQITKWSAEADRRLHRLFSYIHSHPERVLSGSLATNDIDSVQIVAWPDADLAGDIFTTKSTSGRWIELTGTEGRCMPLSWACKRQGATAGHTQEA